MGNNNNIDWAAPSMDHRAVVMIINVNSVCKSTIIHFGRVCEKLRENRQQNLAARQEGKGARRGEGGDAYTAVLCPVVC